RLNTSTPPLDLRRETPPFYRISATTEPHLSPQESCSHHLFGLLRAMGQGSKMASIEPGKQHIPKVAKVKNKAPAEVQITAEQLLREAKERELELLPPPPQQMITDLRYKEVDRARSIYERFVLVHPSVKNWIKYACFEEKHSYLAHARKVYERAVEFFGEEHMDEHLYVAFAKFEENQKEFDRVRVIYKYALDRIPKQDAHDLLKNYTIFEKKFGDRRGIEDIIVCKRRFQYEEEVKANPHNYDAWFNYLQLVESDMDAETVREVYERAIATVPPIQEKRHWKRYIYLWINYALYEELEAKDAERTRQVYQACLELLPHEKFTLAKMWLLYARSEIRQENLLLARRALGTSIGKCPKNKLFKGYIELELQLREFDRCRKLYEKFLGFAPENCTSWIKFAELETILGDIDRARVLWKSYIDFEMEQEECERTRRLYRRLLQHMQHSKVWISLAQFELLVGQEERLQRCRHIYEEANEAMHSCKDKEERVVLLESWRSFKDEFGTPATKERIDKLMPEKIKKRRKLQAEDGSDAGWEEYCDYIFPEDTANQLKLLAMAKLWEKQQQESKAAAMDPDKDIDESQT
uniref:Pre-mRNA-splicing factor Syf1-like N-terminal HAT-repeats domain-containing protein n=1 Tax=Geospiza parvula TaxID=87175 RepID=A0A8U8CDT5_GEOPR